jgi:hypothetical protein
MLSDTQPGEPALGPGYEVRDTNIKAIVLFAVGLVVLLLVSQVGLWVLLKALRGDGAIDRETPSAPEVIVEQRRRLNAGESALLDAPPARIREKDGTVRVRIPIEQAVKLLSERGIPPSTGPARTEIEVNSHDGSPAPATPNAGVK